MKKSFRIVVFGLALAAVALFTRTASAEVLLDVPPIETTNAFLFVDFSDPLAYSYIPKSPRISLWPDGTPKFAFIKYKKTGKDISGGVVHFLVNYGLTQDEIKQATKELQERLKGDAAQDNAIARGVASDPKPEQVQAILSKIKSGASKARVMGPVPFIKGDFNIISASVGTAGIFTRKIVGTGKAPLLAGQDAAVSIALTEEGATFLEQSFKAPTSDVSVQFVMTYEGLTPASNILNGVADEGVGPTVSPPTGFVPPPANPARRKAATDGLCLLRVIIEPMMHSAAKVRREFRPWKIAKTPWRLPNFPHPCVAQKCRSLASKCHFLATHLNFAEPTIGECIIRR